MSYGSCIIAQHCKSLSHQPQRAKSGPRALVLPTLWQGLLQAPGVLMIVLLCCRFLVIRAGLNPPSSVTNTHHAETAISICHHGPRLNSWTREERLYLLACVLAQPFNTLSPGPALRKMSFSKVLSCTFQPRPP